MAEQLNQPHWISAFAENERIRRRRVDSFESQIETFLRLLAEALVADALKYQEEFPGKKVTVDVDNAKGQIVVVNRSLNPETSATIQLHSQAQILTCQFDVRPAKVDDLQQQLYVSNVGIHGLELRVQHLSRIVQSAVKPIVPD